MFLIYKVLLKSSQNVHRKTARQKTFTIEYDLKFMKNRARSQEKSFFFEKILIVLEFWELSQQVNRSGEFIKSFADGSPAL
jgi:hypothetical protein